MGSALYLLSYRAATRPSPYQRKLAHDGPLAPRPVAFASRVRDDGQNLRHNFTSSPRRELNSPPLDYQSSAPPSELRGQLWSAPPRTIVFRPRTLGGALADRQSNSSQPK